MLESAKNHLTRRTRPSCLLLLSSLLVFQTSSSSGADNINNNLQWQDVDQLIQQTFPQTSPGLGPFDSSQFKSIYEAIRAHPELREFGNLCESKGVKEIVGMDKTQLTVFAPVDRALSELLKRQRPLNLVELAKQHIVQGFVAPDEAANYPIQLSSYAALSPIYLNRQVRQTGAPRHSRPTSNYYVNNARILATYLIQIDQDNYQTLHLIDLPLDFVYLNKRTQIRSPIASAASSLSSSSSSTGAMSLSSSSSSMGSSQVSSRYASVKRPLSLDEFATKTEANEQAQAIKEFYDRFADVPANEAHIDLYHARSSGRNGHTTISKDQVNLEKLAKFFRSKPKFRGKLYALNESSAGSLNTYFLPVNSDELDTLLEAANANEDGDLFASALEAHIIPNQVLFTRQMSLGEPFSTNIGPSAGVKVELNLAKSIKSAADNLLATPLLVQANCEPASDRAASQQQQQQQTLPRFGLSQAELLVANIPLSNGVLHLIRRPLLLTDQVSLLDYLNDSDNQLSDVVQAVGSRSSSNRPTAASSQLPLVPVKLNKFRELLARERQLLSSLTSGAANSTMLAPSDEAFSRLRYELRALIEGDDSLVPVHWDDSYKQDLLERLVKRHVIVGRSLTSTELAQLASQSASPSSPLISASGQLVSFKVALSEAGTTLGSPEDNLLVECDSSQAAKLIQKDLVTSNGILHVVDLVLGEDQETIHSLLRSLVLRQEKRSPSSSYLAELSSLVEASLRQLAAPGAGSNGDSFQPIDQTPPQQDSNNHQQQQQQQTSPELELISKTIGQFLDELADSKLQALATSVNVSFQLARLSSLAESHFDWNERFRQTDAKLTYFIPSDLAWLRLQQRQPELFRPLNYFLSSGPNEQADDIQPAVESTSTASSLAPTKLATSSNLKSSESSHRLLQILERHLVPNKKVGERELRHLEAIETAAGATLRLVDVAHFGAPISDPAFAALHSISVVATQTGAPTNQPAGSLAGRALKLNNVQANLVQVNETSNGYLYVVDSVLVEPEDSQYLQQTSPATSSASLSSSMSSLLGGHNSALLEFIQNFVSPSSQALNLSVSSMLALIGTLTLAILILLIVALVLVVRRHKQNKLTNRHEQLESGMTSASSANSGSTSTTKSL